MRFVPFLLVFFATSYLGRPVVAQKAGLRGEKEDDKPLTVSGLSVGGLSKHKWVQDSVLLIVIHTLITNISLCIADFLL